MCGLSLDGLLDASVNVWYTYVLLYFFWGGTLSVNSWDPLKVYLSYVHQSLLVVCFSRLQSNDLKQATSLNRWAV